MDKLFVVMPAYNEEENIKDVVEQWYPVLEGKNPESKLVIADSGSVDKTHELLLEMQKDKEQLMILTDTEKQHGPKLIALYDYSIKNGADFIFQTDSDGQTDPAEFNAFWELRNEYDGIFGNRTERGDGKSRAIVERVVCLLLRCVFGKKVNVPDANAPFRIMNTKVVSKYLYKMDKDYNLPNIMLTAYYVYNDEKRVFKSISFKPRQAGVNSINIPRIIKIGFKAIGDFYRYKKGMKG